MRSAKNLLRMGLLLALAAGGLACVGAASVRGATPRAGVQPQSIATEPEVVLETICTPSGMELCFDATDNNCNGVIDEGCGVQTGLLQFSIAWTDAVADFDLVVTDPKGETAKLGARTSLGLMKDRDCPDDTRVCQGQNVENVFLVGDELARGTYRVLVRFVRAGTAQAPIRVRFGARLGQRSYGTSLEFNDVGRDRVISFVL